MRRRKFAIAFAATAGLTQTIQHAQADFATSFESPVYTAGPLDGQDGWSAVQQANQYGTGNVYSSASNVVVSSAYPSNGSRAVTTSLVTYDNQGGTYQINGFTLSRVVPTTTTPTLVSFDLRVNNTPDDPYIVDKSFFLTNAAGYVIAGIDFQQDTSQADNSVGFYTSFDNGGTAYPAKPSPAPHHIADGISSDPNVVVTPNAYQTWGIEEDPGSNMVHYFLNHVDVYDTPSFQGNSIAGIAMVAENQDALSYNQIQTGETINLDNIIVAPPPSVWNLTGSGSWSNASSWAIVVPNSTGATASFLGAITSNANVNVTAPETVGNIVFDNVHSYTITGSSAITLNNSTAAATINVSSGSHTIQTPVVYTAGLNVTTSADPSAITPSLTLPLNVIATGILTKTGPGTLAFAASASGITTLTLPSINVSAGTFSLGTNSSHFNRTLLSTTSLSIAGKLNLGGNDLNIQAGGTNELVAVTAYLKQGFAGGTWNGSNGIVSLTAASNTTHLTALGVILNSTNQTPTGTALYSNAAGSLGLFDGTNPSSTDVLVKYTYYGDTNLDGKVDGTDYSRIDSGFLGKLTGWYNGDLNYDGVVDGSDYTLIDNAFNTQGAQLLATVAVPFASITDQIAGATQTRAVPEPASGFILASATTWLLRRHRRRPDGSRQ